MDHLRWKLQSWRQGGRCRCSSVNGRLKRRQRWIQTFKNGRIFSTSYCNERILMQDPWLFYDVMWLILRSLVFSDLYRKGLYTSDFWIVRRKPIFQFRDYSRRDILFYVYLYHWMSDFVNILYRSDAENFSNIEMSSILFSNSIVRSKDIRTSSLIESFKINLHGLALLSVILVKI